MKRRGEKQRSEKPNFIFKPFGKEKLPNKPEWVLDRLINPEYFISTTCKLFCVQSSIRVEVITPTRFSKENNFFIFKIFRQLTAENLLNLKNSNLLKEKNRS